jgi:hypothetical protein
MIEPVPTENQSMCFLSTATKSDDKEREVLGRPSSVCQRRVGAFDRAGAQTSLHPVINGISSTFANNRPE